MHISTRRLSAQCGNRGKCDNRGNRRRDGIVLLVVIAMLALFALVGLTFVYYSESVAVSARINRASLTSELRDIPPERILSRFLSDLIFDTDDPTSQLNGLSLARNMYGGAGGRFAYNGTGYDLSSANATYSGIRSTPEFLFGRGNAPYTFPDMNNPYLAWVDDNGVLQARSFFRRGKALRAPNIQPPTNNPAGEGDVKNLDGITSITDFTQIAAAPNLQFQNDSFWIDPNYTGQTKEGVNYKILIAPLILDLDGRVNLATAGNLNSVNSANNPPGVSSRAGLGPWEINPVKLFDFDPNIKFAFSSNLTNANTNIPSRFGIGTSVPALALPPTWFNSLPAGTPSAGAGPVYARFPVRGVEANVNVAQPLQALSPFPSFPATWLDPQAGQKHPAMFDYHRANILKNPGDRRLAVSNTEALCRYGEAGTAGVTSDLFRSMLGLDFSNANHQKLRHLMTTMNMSVDVPHLPAFVPFTGTYKVQPVAANATTTANLTTPILPPQATQFATTTNLDTKIPDPMSADAILKNAMVPPAGQAVSAARINLNQPIANPNVQAAQFFFALCNMAGLPVPNANWQFTGSGYTDNSTNPPTQIDVPTYKYLAQIAVNLVDYMDADTAGASTMFNWSGQQKSADVDYVFGIEQPRLLINEAYCTFDNDYTDLKNSNNMKATFYRLNVFFELLNPSPNAPANLSDYQVLVVKSTAGMDTSGTGTPSNLTIDAASGTTVTVKNWNVAQLAANAGAFQNTGFLVVGPPLNGDADPTKHDTFPDARRPNFTPNGSPPPNGFYQEPALSIHISPANGDPSQPPTLFPPVIVLQRLAKPGVAANNDATSPNYNPYVTVDYFEFQPGQFNPGGNNYSSITLIGDKNMQPPLPASAPDDLTTFKSYGRRQPLSANNVVAQSPIPAPMANSGQPMTTFWRHNSQNSNVAPTQTDGTLTVPFDWCIHLDRPLINRGELLSLSTSNLPTFTHKFGAPNSTLGDAMTTFPNSLLARMFECMYVPSFEYNAGVNAAGVPGATLQPLMRIPGKLNLNLIASKKVAYALFDPQSDSNFATTDVDDFYTKLDTARKNSPSAGNPAGPISGFGDFAYSPTLFGATNPIKTRGGLLSIIGASTLSSSKKTFAKDEALRKIANNVTFTSNTFAVWLTIGFFEQRTVTVGNTTQTQMVELFSEDNRQIRHRMFAIIDRSQLMMPTQVLTTVGPPGSNGPAVAPGTVFPSLFPAGQTKAQSWKLDVGNSFSGTWANTFNPVGTVTMEWKLAVGGTVQVGAQTGHIVAVTPKSSTSPANYIEVAFSPLPNGNPPAQPNQGDPISFPPPITMLPPPLTELGVPVPQAPLTPLIQYGYPGPQPRFNVADNPFVVPYYTIIE